MLVPIDITFRDFEGTPEIEDSIRAEAAKLERFYSPIISCRVLMERPQRAPSGAVYHVRIDTVVPQAELVVRHDPSLHGELQDLEIARSHAEASDVKLHTDPHRAIHEAFKEMRRQLQDHARKLRGDTKRRQDAGIPGRVTRLFPEEGYGFIEDPDNRELYFHRDSVLHNHFDRIRTGTEVSFVEEAGEKGPQASTVRIRHPRKQAREAATTVAATPRKRAAKTAAARQQ